MRLTIRLLGLDLLDIEITDHEPAEHDPMADLSGGTTYSTPLGFTPNHPDQRWEQGVDYQ